MLVRKIQTVVFFLQVRTFLQANLMENPTSTLAGTKGRACYDKHALAIKGATKKRFAFSPAPLSDCNFFFRADPNTKELLQACNAIIIHCRFFPERER
jgi:hypothetical protein